MPGQLVHTNEILVLLGDNWFAERSAKEASEIVDRRIAAVDKSLGDFSEELKLLESRRHFTRDVAQESLDHREIREVYDEEEEKKWKEEHRKNVRSYHQQKRKAAAKQEDQVNEDLWRRLDELEMQEARNNEMNRLSDDEDGDGKPPESRAKSRLIKWEDEEKLQLAGSTSEGSGSAADTNEETESDDEASEAQSNSPRKTIFFKHTEKVDTVHSTTSNSSQEENGDAQKPKSKINSPRDIYLQFAASSSPLDQPKSILKASNPGHPTDYTSQGRSQTICSPGPVSDFTCQDTETQNPALKPANTPQAFTGSVIERSSLSTSNTTEVQDPTLLQPQKRVSKFKAQRLQQEKR
ncbi:unconventional prefoldin RPB5 interactor-like [Lingula anatina]|uniref:Unconventional prefoldin RPB5 interactor-like n=1 Tax=Lingula anatina TaxID=7574 RepID=A0A1S3JSE8_LINAN|nr:unconventional prefoldin RPB5 interactor-like [Lingula anatina]|eukprot:XP_013413288.1 unconventional prefoldin RPB5 interactor-like [Lingula anatina]